MVGGAAGLVFVPDQIKAAVGDMVVFTFMSQNHTATQSSFAKPCDPLAGGMNSGFMANPNNTVSPPPQVAMQVMVSDPLCKSICSHLTSVSTNTSQRVLLRSSQPLRQGHDLLHQPHRREVPGPVPVYGYPAEGQRSSQRHRWRHSPACRSRCLCSRCLRARRCAPCRCSCRSRRSCCRRCRYPRHWPDQRRRCLRLRRHLLSWLFPRGRTRRWCFRRHGRLSPHEHDGGLKRIDGGIDT